MTNDDDAINPVALATLDAFDKEISRVDVSAMAVLNRSEVESQLDAAHRYPRSIGKFLKEATALATLTPEIAASCIYTLPRAGKAITGPSVRLAEIAASAYGNMHVATRVLDAEEKEIAAQGVAWDLEKNLRVTIEARRRITKKDGKTRYDDDMINVTGNAAASIAFRNAIFRVVPRAYVQQVYNAARRVAVGDAKTLSARREGVMLNFGKLGVLKEQVLAKVGKVTVEDVGLDELEILIGIGTSIRDQGATIEEHFPPTLTVAAVTDTKSLEDRLRAQGAKGKKASTVTPITAKAVDSPPVQATHAGEPTDGEPPEGVVLGDDELGGRL
jgi:hypothetical protein